MTEMIRWNQIQTFQALLFQQWSMTDQSSEQKTVLQSEPDNDTIVSQWVGSISTHAQISPLGENW